MGPVRTGSIYFSLQHPKPLFRNINRLCIITVDKPAILNCLGFHSPVLKNVRFCASGIISAKFFSTCVNQGLDFNNCNHQCVPETVGLERNQPDGNKKRLPVTGQPFDLHCREL